MNITPIRTETDHRAALKTIESLMRAKANTAEGDRLDVLFRMEQSGLTPADLEPVIGSAQEVQHLRRAAC